MTTTTFDSLIVKGQLTAKSHVTVQEKLVVQKNSLLQNDAVIQGKLIVSGHASADNMTIADTLRVVENVAIDEKLDTFHLVSNGTNLFHETALGSVQVNSVDLHAAKNVSIQGNLNVLGAVSLLQNSINTMIKTSISATITPAQIRTLIATPILIVAAPGANKFIIVASVMASFIHAGDPVFLNGGGTPVLVYGNTTGSANIAAKIADNSFFSGDSLVTSGTCTTFTNNIHTATASVNKAIYFTVTGVTEYTDGTGSLKIKVDYYTVSV